MPQLKNRRGATAVLVALLIVPLIGFVAFVVDVGRWQAGATELQRAADAAALAGARALQLHASTAGTTVPQYAQNTAEKNLAFNQAANADLVEPMFWDPGNRTLSNAPDGTWGTANAVRVTSSRGGGLIFGGIFNLVSGRTTPVTAPTVSRRGTAWIANIQNGDCIKPWGLPYNALYRIANDAQRPAIDEPPELPSLSQEKLAGIAQKTLTNRTVIVLPYTDPTPPAGAPSDGMWRITLFGSSSMDDYRDFVAGQNCGPARATVGTTDVTTQPSNGNNVVNFTTNGVLGGGNGNNATPPVCYKRAGFGALCFPDATMTQAPGVTVKVAWVSPTGASGNNSNKFRVVGEFLLMCYIGNGGGPSNSCEDTSARPEGPWTPGISSYAYPQATLIGIALGVTSTALGPNTVYGNTVNAYQRIILVK